MSADGADELASLRDEMRALDRGLVELSARRVEVARRIGEVKRARGQPIRNYAVEAEALRLVREAARELGVRPALAEELLKLEIAESLRAQERDRAARPRAAGAARRALVVGGAGSMGRWFVEFLESQGFEATVVDPRGPLNGRPHLPALPDGPVPHDLVLLATPPSATGDALKALAGRAQGVVMDIASLKAPHEAQLRELAASGAKVTSIHPMWGPATDLLASRNLVVCDCGVPEANREARRLFEETAVNLVEMPLAAHDRLMGLVLGLPHAVNLAFGHALARSGTPFAEVERLGGPTFQKQVAVSREVATENKDLYYEIQRLNPHTAEVLGRLRRSLDDLESALAARPAFRGYMAEAERFYGGGTS